MSGRSHAFRRVALVVAAVATPMALRAAQGPPAATQRFDVASIKQCPSNEAPDRSTLGGRSAEQLSPGSAHWICQTITNLIRTAYISFSPLLNNLNGPGTDFTQIVRGGPSWMYTDRYEIEAKAAGDADRKTMQGPMLRALLDDRFQLKTHRATETAPMYALTVATNGLNKDKVKPTAAGECWTFVPGTPRTPPPGFEGKPACGTAHGGWSGGNLRLEYTGEKIGQPGFMSMMDRPVLNQTGLNPDAMYNFVLEFTPDERTPGSLGRGGGGAPADGPSIFKALEALGLKLEQAKGPREYLVIDHIEKPKPDGLVPPVRAQGADSSTSLGASK